jgi:hypothetical protein
LLRNSASALKSAVLIARDPLFRYVYAMFMRRPLRSGAMSQRVSLQAVYTTPKEISRSSCVLWQHTLSQAGDSAGQWDSRQSGQTVDSCSTVSFSNSILALLVIIISGSACSTVGVHSQAWSTSGIGRLGSKSGRG